MTRNSPAATVCIIQKHAPWTFASLSNHVPQSFIMDPKKTSFAADINPELTEIWEVYARERGGDRSDRSSDTNIHKRRWEKLSKNQLPMLGDHDTTQVGDLQLQDPLGAGGMGVVYLAHQHSMGREVAVKLLRDDKKTPEHSQKLLEEARITARLAHPNIIPIHSLGVNADGDPLYVMKRVEGMSWKEVLKQDAQMPTLLDTPEDELDAHLGILEQVCRAVHFAHSKGIVHLDLKAGNVMLGHFGEVYLVDWGISASFDETLNDEELLPQTIELSQPRGTPGFMAPEVASAAGDLIGPHTDVYLLGGILHYILTKQARHRGKDIYTVLGAAYLSEPFEYPPYIAPMLGQICNKAMARQPGDRYESAEAFRQAIARFRQQREGVRLVDEARKLLKQLVEESRTSNEVMTSMLYQRYGELSFALRRARQLGIPKTEGLEGAALRVMFDFELGRENAIAARELLSLASQWNKSDDRRVALLEELEDRLGSKEAWIQHITTEQGDNDASISQRTRGWVLLGATLLWAGVAAISKVLVDQGTIPDGPTTLIAIKAVNTLIAIAIILAAPIFIRMNRANRSIFATLAVAMCSGLMIRTVCVLQEIQMHISLTMETIASLVCVMLLGVFVEKKLLWATPFFVLSVVTSSLMPTRAWELMIIWNMSGLLLMGGIWLTSQRKRRAPRPTPHP